MESRALLAAAAAVGVDVEKPCGLRVLRCFRAVLVWCAQEAQARRRGGGSEGEAGG